MVVQSSTDDMLQCITILPIFGTIGQNFDICSHYPMERRLRWGYILPLTIPKVLGRHGQGPGYHKALVIFKVEITIDQLLQGEGWGELLQGVVEEGEHRLG